MLRTIEGGCWVDCGVSWKWAVIRGCCGGTGVWMDGVTPMMGDCAVTLWLKEGGWGRAYVWGRRLGWLTAATGAAQVGPIDKQTEGQKERD